jgi:hypothetical protein
MEKGEHTTMMPKPNHAIDPTASRRTIPALNEFNPSIRCHARPRSRQLILFLLGICVGRAA